MGQFDHVCSQKIVFTYIQNGFINKILLDYQKQTWNTSEENHRPPTYRIHNSLVLFSKNKSCFLAEKLTWMNKTATFLKTCGVIHAQTRDCPIVILSSRHCHSQPAKKCQFFDIRSTPPIHQHKWRRCTFASIPTALNVDLVPSEGLD